MKLFQNISMRYKILIPMSILLTIALTFIVCLNLYYGNRAITSLASRELQSMVMQHGNDVKGFLDVATNATNDMASITKTMYAEKTPFSRAGLIAMIRGYLNNNKDFVGAGSGWESNAFDDDDYAFRNTLGSNDEGLFIPYLIGSGGVDILTDIEISDWYNVPKNEKRQIVTNPYMYKVGDKDVLMTTSASPVIVNDKFRGVITIDVALDVIINKVLNIRLYDSGYAFLITQNGTYIAHPDTSLIGKLSTREDVKVKLKQISTQDAQAHLELYKTPGREDFYLVYYPIKLGNSNEYWFLVIAVPKAEVLAESTFMVFVSIVAALIILSFSFLIIVVVVRTQMKPLAYMANAATTIAEGNLNYQINDANFDGEMRQLSYAIKSMIASLMKNISVAQKQTDAAQEKGEEARIALEEVSSAKHEMEIKRDVMMTTASELENIVSIINSAAQNISTQIEYASNGALDQANRIAITAEDVGSMNEALLSMANNANVSVELSTNAKNEAFEGAELAEKCKIGINIVRDESLTVKAGMSDLSKHAKNINDIMLVISDIADQTNLLALNAAIEAARAGDAGRGFAVVADEVRKLAEKTMASTTDVGNAIHSIQESSEKSAKQVDSAVEKIHEITEVAEQCNEALKRIVVMIDQADDEVRIIAITSEEQSKTSGEISSSVSDVKNIAEDTLTMMRQSNEAVLQLSEQANQLGILIQRMKQN